MAVQDAMQERTPEAIAPQKVALANNPVARGILYQILVLLAVAGLGYWVVSNAIANLAAQNKQTGLDFLWQTAGFEVGFSLTGFGRGSYYWQALVSGLVSTILVSAIGIVFATIVGFAIGIARLSRNWIVSSLATIYVETIRNIPLLLQLFIWYFAVLKAMPAVRQSYVFLGGVVLNQRGLYVPRLVGDDRFALVLIALATAVVAAIALRLWARRRLEATGKRFPVLLTSLALMIALPLVTVLASGTVITFDMPVLQGFNFRGGLALQPELVALILGLSLYHAAFIGETVRGGILAISTGQTEAAQSLGLREGDRLRLVVIPQAMRVIIPPLTSQYLNVIKNSSLGAAIAYPEFVSIFMGTTLNQTGKAIEVVTITMVVYLTLSLLTSALMNWYNARMALVER